MAVGSAGQVVYQAAPREPAAWPHQVGVIPSRAQSFQHRAEAQRLRAAVEGGGTAVLGQVLTGMGGVGKTQLAADYARTAWDDGAPGCPGVGHRERPRARGQRIRAGRRRAVPGRPG